MTRSFLALLFFVLVSSCAPNLPTRGAESPMLFSANDLNTALVLVIFVPGSVTSGDVFWRAFEWRDEKTALAFYRLPGFDGLPMDHMIGVEAAADEIAAFASQYADKEIRLVGYSQGATIALLAASRIHAQNVKVAAIAPAPEMAGGVRTLANGANDFALATWRAQSLKRTQIWREYFKIMLHGRRQEVRAEKAEQIDGFMNENEEHIIAPSQDIVRAHTWDLRFWRMSETYTLDNARAAIFVGLEDPMFSTRQSQELAAKFGVTRLFGYPGDGHLLLITRPNIFADIDAFFTGRLR